MQDNSKPGSRRVSNLISGGLFVLAVLIFTVPWQVGLLDFSAGHALRVDLAGFVVMNHLFASGADFGSDVAYPYGPFLFLMFPNYWPGTFWYIIMGRLFIALAFALAIWRFGRSLEIWTPFTAAVAFVGVMVIYLVLGREFLNFAGMDTFLFAAAPLLLYLYAINVRKQLPIELYILAVAAAPIALTRFSTFMVLGVMFAIMTISDIVFRRSPPLLLATFVFAFVATWMIAGQDVGSIPGWIQNSYLMGQDFAGAMGGGYLEPQRLVEVVVFLISGLILVAAHYEALRSRGLTLAQNALFAVGLLLLLYVSFKHGVVRHDAHARVTASDYVAIGSLLLFILAGTKRNLPNFRFLSAALAAVFVAMAVIYGLYGSYPDPRSVLSAYRDHLTAMTRPFATEASLNAEYETQRASFRAAMDLPEVSGTVDQWPDNGAIPVLVGYDYAPRPSPMSFSVYSEAVSQLNAEFLDGPEAPENMIFQVATIDGRIPTIDDPLAWLALIRNYNVAASWNQNLALLSHRPSPRTIASQEIAHTSIGWGQTFDIGAAGVIEGPGQFLTVEIDTRLSLLGKLLSLAFKPPEVWIEVTYRNGTTNRFRLVPLNARLGFVLSPTVIDQHSLFQLFGVPNFSSPLEVASFSVTQVPALGFAFQPEIGVRLVSNQIDPPLADVPQDQGVQQIASLAELEIESAGPIPPAIRGGIPDARWMVLFAHAPTTLSVDVDNVASSAEIGFGMLPGSVAGTSGDGVTFRVIGKTNPSDEGDILLERHLDPAHEPADAGTKTEVLTFSPGTYQKLVLQTGPGALENYDYDQSYWSEVELR